MARFRFRNIFNRREKQLETKNQPLGNYSTRLNTMYAQSPEHALIQMLNQCSVKDTIPLPRQWVKLSRLLYSKVSLYKDAIDKTADFVGNVRISDKSNISERTRSIVTAFWEKNPVLSEFESQASSINGVNPLVNELVKIALRDGLAFTECRFVERDEEITDEYLGSMLFDSDNFEYAPVGGGTELSLRYLGNQFPQVDPDTGERLKNPYFHILKLENDTRAPWGMPLAAGDEMLAKVLIALLVSIELQAKRFGNPPTLTAISPSNLKTEGVEFVSGGQVTPMNELMIKAARSLKQGIENAFAMSHRGIAAEVVQGFPAPVEIYSKILGEGMVNMVDPDLLWKLCVLLINGFGVPPSLMSVNITSGGMNSDMFSTSIQVFRSRVSRIRERVLPIIRQKTTNYLLSQGVPPREAEALVIEFSDVDLKNPLQKTELAHKEAEVKGLQIQNYENLANYDQAAADEYAAEVGLFKGS